MRKRATEAATTQMGRMGAEAPVGISGHIPQRRVQKERSHRIRGSPAPATAASTLPTQMS